MSDYRFEITGDLGAEDDDGAQRALDELVRLLSNSDLAYNLEATADLVEA